MQEWVNIPKSINTKTGNDTITSPDAENLWQKSAMYPGENFYKLVVLAMYFNRVHT